MIKSKHVVQAQRKFALGAVVPTQPERRAEPAPAALPPPEPGDVRHCGMSAPQLLNSVMMMGIHTHKVCQPVVVLERLNENDNDTLQNTRSLKTPPQAKPRQPTKHLGHQKASPLKQASCRSLRSHVKHTRKRRFSESSSVTDIEDNKPLKYIQNKKYQSDNQKNIKATKCTSAELKRVSLRQIKLRKNEEAKKRRKEEDMFSNEITEPKRLRKKMRSGVRKTLVLGRTAPHTRARHEANATTSTPLLSSLSGIMDNTPPDSSFLIQVRNKVKLPKATQFKKPRVVRSVNAIRDKVPSEPKKQKVNAINDQMSTVQVEPRYNSNSDEKPSVPVEPLFNSSSVDTLAVPVEPKVNSSSDETPSVPVEPQVNSSSDKTPSVPVKPLVNSSSDKTPLVPVELRDNSNSDETTTEPVQPQVNSSSDEMRVRPTACSHTGSHDQLRACTVSELDDTALRIPPNALDVMISSTFSIEEHLYNMKMDLDGIENSPSPRPPATSPCAAPDVYTFNEETEAEAEPFRANRSRQVQPSRFASKDLALAKRKSDGVSTQITNLSIPTTLHAESIETVVIDDDDEDDDSPKDKLVEPDDGQEAMKILWKQGKCGASELADEDDDDGPEIAEAPAFYPTKEEMRDLNNYIEKVEPLARKYGIFKIVPPRDFQPPCQLRNVQFKSTNQYVSSMYSRWGPAASEMTAIKAHLATQNVAFTRPPLFEGVEVDLVKLYHLVQENGGLIRVIEERKWAAIAEKMQLNARAGRVNAAVKLDKIYLKHLLPYETLSEEERTELRARVTAAWHTRYWRQRARASRPLHRQRRLLGESESSGEDEEPEPAELATAFLEVEDCVLPGSNMNLARFRRVGERVRDMRFPGASADAPPHWADVERAYWRLVRKGTEHICVHGAALDTSQDALGFPAAIDAPYGNHPWNLKRLGESENNVLSCLGPTLAVTIPTLHLGMMFSTNCWHHDPHHLPWTEYMHQGPPKIWYGIADSESGTFRAAAEKLCPTAVQQKALWLPSDTAMMPPRVLAACGVRLVRALQAPGEYVVVLPRAYSCSISTGLTVSESLYFAGDSWLDGIDKVFAALRADAEPSMFALEALLEGVVHHPAAPVPRLLRARALLRPLLDAEKTRRREAAMLGVRALSPHDFLKEKRRCSKTSWQVVRDECHVCRATVHWSKIVDVSSRVSVCLEHGLRLVRVRNPKAPSRVEPGAEKLPNVEDFTTILFYSDHQISQLLAEIDKPILK